jgi:Protein of unknown function (DUF1559)
MNYGAIRSILLTVILLAASWAAFGAVSGTAVSAILLASAAYFLVRESRWTQSIRIATVVLGLSALVGLLVPAVNAAREAARSLRCENRLRQIGIGVRAYWDYHGCYPPTCTYDKSGRPLHSWRVLIKDFLSSIPDQYNYTEPWDSPSNRQFLANRHLAFIYQCPTDEAARAPDSAATSYVAIVGKKATWRRGKAESPDHESTDQKLPNQAADAFLVIEMHDSGIQWTEPKDIDFDDVPALQSIAAKSLHTRDHGYFYCKTPAVNAVLVHGDMVFMFPWDSRTSVLTGLLPPQELLHPEDPSIETHRFSKGDLQLFQEELRVNWPHLVGLPVWIVAVALLSYQGIVTSRRLGV